MTSRFCSLDLFFAFQMIENVLDKLQDLFTRGNADFRVLHHAQAGQSSASVAAIRGTELGQGAKALCCTVKGPGKKRQHVLAVLPADCQADLPRIAEAVDGRRTNLASPDEVLTLTGCIFGAVPPVSFHPDLQVIADPSLLTRYEELVFNAGQRDVSIFIKTVDYHRIVNPKIWSFAKLPESDKH